MILIINICKEELHSFEFVEPVKSIIQDLEMDFFEKHYSQLNEKDLKKADKIIICGTSLFDNEFIKNINKFKWILEFNKPILGICGGMQIVGLIFGSKIRKMTEMGFYSEYFHKNFLGLNGKCEVYHLHNNYIDFNKLKEFEVYCGKEFRTSHSDLACPEKKISKSECSQAVKHREKHIYGVLFHPEVRQKDLIKNFCWL
jgi:anthranilate/para-aminobenzoate synthase component II